MMPVPKDENKGSTYFHFLWQRCQRFAVHIVFLIPLTAAFAKAFTNSFSTLSVFVFCTTGVFIVNPALFAGPVLIVICAMGAATVLISMNMEGRSLYSWLSKLIESEAMEKQRNNLDPLDYYIIQLFSLSSLFPDKIKKYMLFALALLAFILSSATKGFAMVPGVLNILAIIVLSTSGVPVWIIIGVAACAVMAVSVAKEGKKLLKKIDIFLPEAKQKDQPRLVSRYYQGFVYFFAALLPIIAALAKACGTSYGFLMLLAFMYTGSFAGVAAVSAWLPLIIVMGIGVACVSLRMEGHSLFKLIRRFLISDEEIPNFHSKFYLKEEDREKVRCEENQFFGKYEDLNYIKGFYEIDIETGLQDCYWKLYLYTFGSFFFNRVIGWGFPILTFMAKSSIMMVGTISAIVLLSGGMPITGWLLAIGALAGLTVGLVSLGKEGFKTHNSIRKYYILSVYRLTFGTFPEKHLKFLRSLEKDCLNAQKEKRETFPEPRDTPTLRARKPLPKARRGEASSPREALIF